MNPGFEKYEEYTKYKIILKKIKTIEKLDGVDINDNLDIFNKKTQGASTAIPNLFSFDDNSNPLSNNIQVTGGFNRNVASIDEMDEQDILNNLIKQKRRQSTITFSQRMLKKADNLIKFNRKNHSEGNKHITNNDL